MEHIKIERVYNNVFASEAITFRPGIKNSKVRFAYEFTVSLAACLYVFLKGGNGLRFHFYVLAKAWSAFIRKKIDLKKFKQLGLSPLDSFRYFEFEMAFQYLKNQKPASFVDISSPRFFPAYLLDNVFSVSRACLINPDVKDANDTNELFKQLKIGKGNEVFGGFLSQMDVKQNSIEVTTSISVLEHVQNLEVLNSLLEHIFHVSMPGGTVVISVPVAKKAFDEYINFNEYGLSNESDNGFFFGQRFFNNQLLESTIFKVFGKPQEVRILGEKQKGTFFQDRFEKINDPNFKNYLEPYRFHRDYERVVSLDQLTGIGVAVFLFKVIK